MRLRRSSPDQPGWTRRRAGKGFVYLDAEGGRLGPEDVQRIKDLVIPPAWQEVWICPWPHGHLQAVGTDDAGRRQYLYHPEWRIRRDGEKYERVLGFGRALGRARGRVLEDLAGEGMSRERACAVAVRLLDLGYFRIGNDVYAEENQSFGLTTLERRHVRRAAGGHLVFEFTGKSGIDHRIEIDDPGVLGALEVMRRRRGGDDRLLAWKDGRRWRPMDAASVNEYVGEVTGVAATAKDFRTWHATVLAAAALAEAGVGPTETARKRTVRAAIKEVAEFLGNTPALARSAYVDPRVLDAYDEGRTIEAATRRSYLDPDTRQAALERAVLRLLAG